MVRNFCLTVSYHSPKAYDYIRGVFNNHLPHPKVLKSWYANSDCCSDEGIQQSCLDKLKRIAQDYEKQHKSTLLCSLVFDEINIRRQILYSMHQTEFIGYVQPPENGDEASMTKKKNATQAIVFILNGIETNFEFPVAYYFINGLKAGERNLLLSKVIASVTDCGIRITNITFDGCPSNIPMCELLGADLNVESDLFRPYFMNAINGERIYVIFDPCHAEKLVRNTLAGKRIIYDDNNHKIDYRFFESLYKFSNENDYQTHKLSKKHMQWQNNVMNVAVATQTLSGSVANSMQFLMEQNHIEFIDAAPTIRLVY